MMGRMSDGMRERLERLKRCPKPDAERLRADVEAATRHDPELGARFGAVVNLLMLVWPLVETFVAYRNRLTRFFTSVSEKTRKLFPGKEAAGEAGAPGEAGVEDPARAGEHPSPDSRAKPGRVKPPADQKARLGKKKRFPGAKTVVHEHPNLKCGERCPECDRGNLYDFKAASYLRYLGRALLGLEEHKYKRLRCSGCQQVFSQDVPPEMKEPSDEAARALLAILKYDGGMPFNRLQTLTGNFGVEVPKSTVFDMAEKVADAVAPVHEALVDVSADAEVIVADDTAMRILDHEDEREETERKAIHTTGIVAKSEGGPTVHLFFTGPRHAGENLVELRARRDETLADPVQMSDALASNFPADLRMIAGKCLVHGRRNFVDCREAFPAECEWMIRKIGEVYANERECKARGLDKFARLDWHLERSGPEMEEIRAFAKRHLDERLAEPNGELGRAFKYLLNHWEGLTLFLRVPGCPLDTTEVERALKVPIRNRKNALFYKTRHGAAVGDILMSVIRTAKAAGVNPFDYLTDLQRHKSRVFNEPEAWLPWNYKATLERAEAEDPRKDGADVDDSDEEDVADIADDDGMGADEEHPAIDEAAAS